MSIVDQELTVRQQVMSVSVVEVKAVPTWFYCCLYRLIINRDSSDVPSLCGHQHSLVFSASERAVLFIFQSCRDAVEVQGAHMGSPSSPLAGLFLNTEHTNEDYEWDVPQIYLTLEHSFGGVGQALVGQMPRTGMGVESSVWL